MKGGGTMKIDYTRSIVNITASIEHYYTGEHNHPTLETLDQALNKQPDHVVLALMDGFGMNLMRHHLNRDGFFNKNLKSQLTSVFPSTTTAATTAVLTGKTPYESGFLGWFMRFPKDDLHYTVFMSEDYYEPHKAIPLDMQSRFYRETFLDRIQEKDPTIKTQAFFPFPVIKDGHRTIEDGLKRVKAFQANHPKTLVYLYWVEPDLSQHKTGVKSTETKQQATIIENAFKDYHHTSSPNTLTIVTADHGLIDVIGEPLLDDAMRDCFEALPALEPRFTTFFVKPDKKDTFETLFKKRHADNFTLYTTDAFLQTGLLGKGKRHPFVNQCLGNYISIAKSNKHFLFSDTNHHKAHHAGLSSDELDVPLIVFKGVNHP